MRSLLLVAALMSAFALPRLHGQNPARSDAIPAFETASVKTELIVFVFPRPDEKPRAD